MRDSSIIRQMVVRRAYEVLLKNPESAGAVNKGH